MMVVETLAAILIVVVLLPVCVFTLQVFAAGREALHLRPVAPDVNEPNSCAGLLVLVPAHNEALVLADTLRSLRPQLRIHDRLLIVADNCEDDTAAIARHAGAEVVVRDDPKHRGKGYALAHGIDHLRKHGGPPIIVVVDADCQLGPGALDTLRNGVVKTRRPVQALYLMIPSPEAGERQNVSIFAWRVKNWLRPRGAHRLGWPCQLTGSGMAIPWSLLEQADLRHGGIVEDMQLGLDLALLGFSPIFCESALITSTLAPSRASEAVQRARWERGHIGQIWTKAPSVAASAWRARDAHQWQLLLDLTVPPIALLAWIVCALVVTYSIMAAIDPRFIWLAVAASATAMTICVAIHRAWRCCGTDLIAKRDVPALLKYAVMKLPHYAGMALQRRAAWTKTRRNL